VQHSTKVWSINIAKNIQHEEIKQVLDPESDMTRMLEISGD
jgi:hypothetical protein